MPVTVQIARARKVAREQVLTCDRCDLHRACTAPVPFHGPVGARLAVVGEAPGRQEDKAARPFVGPAGRLLRQLLGDAGFDPEQLVWLNTVSCFPNRTPNRSEQEACRPNLGGQLASLSPEHVLVVGSVALEAFRTDLKITAAHGRVMAADPWGFWTFPVHHPSAALRNPALVPVLAADLHRWATVVSTEMLPDWFGLGCVACGRLVDRYDPDGIGWCAQHIGRGTRSWQKAFRVRAAWHQPPPRSAPAPAIQAALL